MPRIPLNVGRSSRRGFDCHAPVPPALVSGVMTSSVDSRSASERRGATKPTAITIRFKPGWRDRLHWLLRIKADREVEWI